MMFPPGICSVLYPRFGWTLYLEKRSERRARVKRMHPRARLAHQIWVPSLPHVSHPSIRPRWTCIGHHPEPHCAVAPKSLMDAGRSVEREADRFQCIKSRNSHIHSSLSEAPREHARPTSSHTATNYINSFPQVSTFNFCPYS